jgi:FkbM family methyltransferase
MAEDILKRAISIIKRDGVGILFKKAISTILFRTLKCYHRLLCSNKVANKLMTINCLNFRISINPGMGGIHQDLFFDKIREPYATRLLREYLKKGDVILEVGANIGYYVLVESKSIGKKGLIYAIEPGKENFEFLKRNIQINNVRNTLPFNIALGDKNELKELYVYSEGNFNTFLNKKRNLKLIRKDKIKIIRGDDFLKGKRKPTVIRMDVEGYEYEIIKGLQKTISSSKNMLIFMELHFGVLSKNKVNFILNFLKKNGFKILDVFPYDPKGILHHKILSRLLEKVRESIVNKEKLRNYEYLKQIRSGSYECFFVKGDR